MIPRLVAIFLWFLLLGSPLRAFATPVTFEYTSTHVSTGGVVTGSFTYETTASPLALDVGLSPNATYAMTQWNFSVISGTDVIADTIFSSNDAGNSLEFCVGNCVFAGGSTIRLTLLNSDFTSRIIFTSLDPTPITSPPANLSEWGAFIEADYHPASDSVPLLVYREATLTQSVPEPQSALLAVIGLAAVFIWSSRKRIIEG